MATLQTTPIFSDDTGDVYSLSLLKGQQTNIPFEYDDKRDLTNYTITVAEMEWYAASLTTTGESLNISRMELTPSIPATAQPSIAKADQATNPGKFNVHIPSTLHTGSNPAPNLSEEVPLASILVEIDDKQALGEISFIRILVVYRRGKSGA